MGLYTAIIRPALFRLDAEWVHDRAIGACALAGRMGPLCRWLDSRHRVRDPRLNVEVAGLSFDNPVGLAAGFDKSGRAARTLASLGFGHVEVGSVSADASDGNPKPRLWRLPEDRAILVHYGLPNDGAEAVAERLDGISLPVPLGLNVVKTNRGPGAPPEPEDDIIEDYVRSVARLRDVADYLTLNLSCPNTQTGRNHFAEPGNTGRLLSALADIEPACPVFLKVALPESPAETETLLEEVEPFGFVSGFTYNLPPGQPEGLRTSADFLAGKLGAVSGSPVQERIDAAIADLYARMDRSRYAIIGAGGVFTAEDAYRKLRLGASLVQLMTAMIYEGPGVVWKINRGLCELLERDGVKSVAEVVGVDA